MGERDVGLQGVARVKVPVLRHRGAGGLVAEALPERTDDRRDVNEAVRVLREGEFGDAVARGFVAVLGDLVKAKPHRGLRVGPEM